VPPVAAPGPAASTGTLDLRSNGRRLTLTSADLTRYVAGSTLDIIRQLRPEFFMPSARAPSRPHAAIALYVNNAYDGDVAGLNSIPIEEIDEIDFLHPFEGTLRFGTACRCDGGAILVKTKKIGRR
jgi:hypothetical protein